MRTRYAIAFLAGTVSTFLWSIVVGFVVYLVVDRNDRASATDRNATDAMDNVVVVGTIAAPITGIVSIIVLSEFCRHAK